MRAFFDASNSADVRDLINRFYDKSAVQGFALGVDGRYISFYRTEFAPAAPISKILDPKAPVPGAWKELCERASLPANLSPIYVVIYVTDPPDEFRSFNQVPVVTSSGAHFVVVEQKGPFVALADRTKHRPVQGGISVGNAALNLSGTLGGFLTDVYSPGGQEYALSCNHVLDDSFVTESLQQGSTDGGKSPSETLGTTIYAVPLKLSTTFTAAATYDSVDAAVAEVATSVAVNPTVRHVGRVTTAALTAAISLGDDVVFVGKESDRQEARVYRFISRLKVKIKGGTYSFGDVFEIEPRLHMYFGSLAQPGDSGSWVIRESPHQNELYGLLFAGSGTFAACCFIETVVNELDSVTSKSFVLA
jgi:hypothetical protein